MARTARIALLQLPAFALDEASASLAHTLRRIDEAAAQRPDVIVLPEVTYPAYFLGHSDLRGLAAPAPGEAAGQFAERARAHGVHIAAGLALPAAGGGFTNSAILFGRDGKTNGRYDKSFLWHFDNRWFAPGDAYPVFETDAGRIGMLICADGRLPEIARCLTLNGAQIILDLTAWVSAGRTPADLTSTQREYLMPARAAENGVWIACASKYGVEAESIVYCGRSCVIDPHGRVVAELGPDDDATLTYDVSLEDARPPVTRRPELYETLTHPTDSLPVMRALSVPAVISEHDHHVAAVQMTVPQEQAAFVAAAGRHARRLAMFGAELAALPATPGRYRTRYAHDALVEAMHGIARETGLMLAFTVNEGEQGAGQRAMYLVSPRGVLARHCQTHKPPGPRFETMPLGDDVCPIVETPIGRVGLLAGAEGFVPEVARSLVLRGAETLLWSTDDPALPMSTFARCRAEENRVSVVCAAAPSETGEAMIVEPGGRVLARALRGGELAVTATINPLLSRIKERAPGTDVIRGRLPATYGAITAPVAATVP